MCNLLIKPRELQPEQFHFADHACTHVVKAMQSSGALVDFSFNTKFSKAA